MSLLYIITGLCALLTMGQITANTPNKVNWVEVVKHRLSTQIMFDFAFPVKCERKILPKNNQLKLFFPQVDYHSCNAESITRKLGVLKDIGLIRSFSIKQQTGAKPGVVLALNLVQNKDQKGKPSEFLIKTCLLDNPHRFILNIFSREDLELFKRKDALIQVASNDTLQYDSELSGEKKKRTELRVMIDAGHGGSENGTTAPCGTMEKQLTLSIAHEVQKILKQRKINALMTRTTDKTLSLADRCNLAGQMKADMFVSIHVNSSGIYPSSRHEGIESFYLDGKKQLGGKNVSFIFVNMPTDYKLAHDITHELNNTLNKSHHLARSIHTNLVESVRKDAHPSVNDRGVKKNQLRVLMMNQIPAALIEVGFLTNIDERKRLKSRAYRKTVAQGIADGIERYISHHHHSIPSI